MTDTKELSSSPMNDLKKKEIMERVVIAGDLAKLTPEDRTKYYMAVCESVGLNPFTKPFELITLGGKMIMYATRTATDQLRSVQKVSITKLEKVKENDVYIVTAYAQSADGRIDSSTGVVAITGLKGDALANAYMKAETKAKRRVTLSIVGLGWMDESEVDSIRGAEKHVIDIESGEIDQPKLNDKPTKQQLKELFEYSKLHGKIELAQKWFSDNHMKGSNDLNMAQYVQLMADLSLKNSKVVEVASSQIETPPWDDDPRNVK
jgi:hypothetical protein